MKMWSSILFIGCVLGLTHVVVTMPTTDELQQQQPLRPVLTTLQSQHTRLPRSTFFESQMRNISKTTDLREFIMQYVQDLRICRDPAMRDYLLAEGGSGGSGGGGGSVDERAKVWWSTRCSGRRSGPILTSHRPSHSESSRNDQKKLKKIEKLMKDKRIKCKPKKTAVPLPNSDPHTELKPECVYIKRCSGCCNSPKLECVPVKTKNKTFPAMELSRSSTAYSFAGDTIRMVKVVEHVKCQCECKIRAEHCTSIQEYNAEACQCQCPSHLSRSCPSRKVWNEKECRCECVRPLECTPGRYFDVNTCRC